MGPDFPSDPHVQHVDSSLSELTGKREVCGETTKRCDISADKYTASQHSDAILARTNEYTASQLSDAILARTNTQPVNLAMRY